MTEKIPVKVEMRVKAYNVIADAVEEGVEYGWSHAHKHTDAPSDFAIKEEITQAVLNAICERFEFPEERDD